ncbi:ABC transporter permease subunit [Demequina zhanjiangensis]|uniref:ABC transporter permease subunit n=1 Tax=Demequina zhanjiangensis TaxID=3051659 RepID=A0ABT8FYZ6_9MICO|nr:ABC transporter permease subunit [Demequina sp. SYSU T00b26]MDN4472123.1 ABC transporter permease subunit [Demequina sp. SYSU T00b26]
MLRTLYLKSIRDRWIGALIGVAALTATALLSMWAYSGMGDEVLTFFDQMPEFYSTAIGLSSVGGVTMLMMSMMLNFLGPFVIAGIAISIGAATFAGEERTGTVNILTTVPRSRRRLLWSKTAAMVTVLLGAGLASWGGYALSVVAFGETTEGVDVGAATVHVLAVSLLFGSLALMLSTSTGQQALGSGVATGLLVLSFLISGVVPLISGWEDWAQISPWYYISDGDPLANGVQWTPVLWMLAGSVVLIAVAFLTLDARDLKSGEGRLPLVERVTGDPRVEKALAMLRGRSNATGVVGITMAEGRAALTIAGGGIFLMMFALGPLFLAVSDFVGEFASAFPDSIMALVGFADYSTPEGWYHGEGLSIVAPVAVAVVAIGRGASLALEERTRRVSFVMGSPISRAAFAWRKLAAAVLMAAGAGALAGAGMAAGNLVAGLGLDWGNVAGATLSLMLLGTTLAAVAFLGGALSGNPSVANGAGIGVAIVGWAVASFAEINDALEPWARLSPFYYYSSNVPLENGLIWWHVGVLAVATAVLGSAGVWAYTRRDLRG